MATQLHRIQNWLGLARDSNWSVTALAKRSGVAIRTMKRRSQYKMGRSPRAWLAQHMRPSIILLTSLLLANVGLCGFPEGSWSLSGKIIDLRISAEGLQASNTLSLSGQCSNDRFLINLVPIKTQDDIAESAGWDGSDLFLIARQPDSENLRTNSFGYIEPTIFSRYATPALTSVITAFADSNALSRLESGIEVVILRIWRKYPEESNTYTVDYLPSGGIHIIAHCPGLKIDPSGDMVPVQGFEHGFTRWTFTSNLKGPNTLLTEYDRFEPEQGKLVQIRKVTSDILLEREDVGAHSFLPDIPENSLTVFDYSQRQALAQFYKAGLFDQNHIYKLTNHVWNFGYYSNVVARDFAHRKTLLARKGIPKDLVDTPPNYHTLSPIVEQHRTLIKCGLIAISVLFVLAIWFSSWKRYSNCNKTERK